ncbi:MAG: RecQ family ATP-dependent DNA helicase [Bacteroidia bacterium]|nr:RecQ family ATP-dependent DNA helicase [Bacteroidia bacterium]
MLQTLKKYWGYTAFRPNQEDIIRAVCSGRDTLALLPTGGGKSICYQLPALELEGVCLVVSPLVALMRDQVELLKSKGISATYLYSGLSRRELQIEYENMRNGKYVLVYVSPERLKSPDFQNSLGMTNLSFVAVDEAHCISQWGHDFRPVYREIGQIRLLKPEIPILALTASATAQVQQDIIEQLELRNTALYKSEFLRPNLSYQVRYTEDKRGELLRHIQVTPGSGIVYVRSRRKTVEIANYLRNANIVANYYHAGLSSTERNQRQDAWQNGHTRVMVSTNAFGMGIDKPDVRFVLHYDLPDSIESYYQEAGRAGRDGNDALCLLMYEEADMLDGRSRISGRFPSLERVNRIYQNLCNYFELAYHTGNDARFDFDLEDFCKKFENNALETYSSLNVLEQLNYLLPSDGFRRPSRLKINVSSTELYDFQLKNIRFDALIKLILRSYSGIFDHYAVIREPALAKRLKHTVKQVVANLNTLKQLKLLDYIESTDVPFITFLQPRVEKIVDREAWLKTNRKRTEDRFEALVQYIEEEECRSRLIGEYFGEEQKEDCGKCDVCNLKQRYAFSSDDFSVIENQVRALLAEPMEYGQLVRSILGYSEDQVHGVLKWMMDDGLVHLREGLMEIRS